MSTHPTLLRDVITIPESVHKGDLVYQLAEATDNPALTIAKYVVTDQLRQAFHDAVALVRSSVNDHSSKAAYLHGSFGCGKSNFMGVLQLLLDGNPIARAVPELADVVADIDSWRAERRFLTVPFHLIGEHDLESAVFGQYIAYLARTHPDACLRLRFLPMNRYWRTPMSFAPASVTRSSSNDFPRVPPGTATGARSPTRGPPRLTTRPVRRFMAPPIGSASSKRSPVPGCRASAKLGPRQSQRIRELCRWTRRDQPPRPEPGLWRSHPVPRRAHLVVLVTSGRYGVGQRRIIEAVQAGGSVKRITPGTDHLDHRSPARPPRARRRQRARCREAELCRPTLLPGGPIRHDPPR